jgi:hypothetical protein
MTNAERVTKCTDEIKDVLKRHGMIGVAYITGFELQGNQYVMDGETIFESAVPLPKEVWAAYTPRVKAAVGRVIDYIENAPIPEVDA